MREDDGRATASLNWYRQMLVERLRPRSAPKVIKSPDRHQHGVPPTTYLWGEDDSFLGPAAARRTVDTIPDIKFIALAGGGHWLPETHPAEVCTAIINATS